MLADEALPAVGSSASSSAAPQAKIVIGITGVSRSGKGWVSKGVVQAVEAAGKKATIIGQDDFWFQACQVDVRGQTRMSEEEAECTDHEKFAAAIKESMSTNDVVIAEGFQLVYHPHVTALLSQIFLIELDKDEACSRRTQPRDDTGNPNPLTPEDFDDLLWPAHERYMKDKIVPLGTRIAQLQSPTDPAQRDELVQGIMRAAGLAEAALPGGFPFEPPEEVKRKLRQEDWDVMANAWDHAEAEAQAWAVYGTSVSDSLYSGGSVEKRAQTSQTRHKKRRPKWNQDFSMIGKDTGKPPPLRRYFDSVPSEASVPKQTLRPDVRKMFRTMSLGQESSIFSIQHPSIPPSIEEAAAKRMSRTVSGFSLGERENGWTQKHGLTCSVDNPGIHPHLRHYFDQRGLESSYRQRPEVDKGMPRLPSRTSGRPSTREKILRHYSSEAAAHLIASLDGAKVKNPAIANAAPEYEVDAGKRGGGNIHWGRRCLTYGPDKSVRQGEDGGKIPWVFDHHTSEAEDNPILNPMLRHFFDSDGLESSFRARGRHYGRPLRAVVGIPPLPTMGRSQSEASMNGAH